MWLFIYPGSGIDAKIQETSFNWANKNLSKTNAHHNTNPIDFLKKSEE